MKRCSSSSPSKTWSARAADLFRPVHDRSGGYISELSVTGLTSNSTIFDHAFKNSDVYDLQGASFRVSRVTLSSQRL